MSTTKDKINGPGPQTPLAIFHTAIKTDDVKMLKTVVPDHFGWEFRFEFDPDPHSSDTYNGPAIGYYTPLIHACEAKAEKCVSWLLANGVNVNHLNHRGYSPLIVAARTGSLEICKMLIRAGADRNIRYGNGRTAESDAPTDAFELRNLLAPLESKSRPKAIVIPFSKKR